MSFERSRFNKLEEKEVEERKLPKAESEQMLGEMDEYTNGLSAMLKEKQQELAALEKNEKANPGQVEFLKSDIQELEEQISGLTEFSEEGKKEGAEFTEKDAK